MTLKEQIDMERLPKHIAIIMDGHGRWAKERGKPRLFGHRNAIKSVRAVTEASNELGVKCLTLYAFSTENWNRPLEEVSGLMVLMGQTIKKEIANMVRDNIRLKISGDLSRMPRVNYEQVKYALDATKNCTGMILNVALSYSGRWDITEAARQIAKEAVEGKLNPDDITENTISEHVCTAGIPDPELMIRTSGELRISNYLLWQLAYSELYFTKKYWPDFGKEDLYEAIVDYQHRERRFGKTSEQVTK